eukprot:3763348-Amphidinium_carterae.1
MVDKYSDLGWLEGDFDPSFLDNMHNLFDLAVKHPQVDPKKVFLFGFSAGGYALTEMMASHRGLNARALILGGIHGHGNTVEEARKFEMAAKQGLDTLVSYELVIAVHNVLDTLSPWGPAQIILDALDPPRIFDAAPGIKRVLLNKPASKSMGKSAHNYGKDAVQQLYLLMATAASETATTQARSSSRAPFLAVATSSCAAEAPTPVSEQVPNSLSRRRAPRS